jgi:hypothetical protein
VAAVLRRQAVKKSKAIKTSLYATAKSGVVTVVLNAFVAKIAGRRRESLFARFVG